MTKILVIDDEPSIINLVTAYLKPEGYEVYTATDGNTGLELHHGKCYYEKYRCIRKNVTYR